MKEERTLNYEVILPVVASLNYLLQTKGLKIRDVLRILEGYYFGVKDSGGSFESVAEDYLLIEIGALYELEKIPEDLRGIKKDIEEWNEKYPSGTDVPWAE